MQLVSGRLMIGLTMIWTFNALKYSFYTWLNGRNFLIDMYICNIIILDQNLSDSVTSSLSLSLFHQELPHLSPAISG